MNNLIKAISIGTAVVVAAGALYYNLPHKRKLRREWWRVKDSGYLHAESEIIYILDEHLKGLTAEQKANFFEQPAFTDALREFEAGKRTAAQFERVVVFVKNHYIGL